jgi:hypothetical protein
VSEFFARKRLVKVDAGLRTASLGFRIWRPRPEAAVHLRSRSAHAFTVAPLASLLALAAALLLGGCSTYRIASDGRHDFAATKRFFVETPLTDDHQIGTAIVAALRSHGREADRGPITMLPDSAEVIVSFQDRWFWDVKYHMTSLRLTARDPNTDAILGWVSFDGATAMNANPGEVVARLVAAMLAPPQKPKR